MQSTKKLFLSLAAVAALTLGVGAPLTSVARAEAPAKKAPAKAATVTLHIAGMT